MGKSNPNPPAPEQEIGNLEPEDVVTNQEGIAVPWLCGEAKFALRWISPAYDQFSRKAGSWNVTVSGAGAGGGGLNTRPTMTRRLN